MAIDGFFIKHLTKELTTNILNNRLEKVFQLDKSTFMFNFYLRGKRSHLAVKLAAPHAGVFLVDNFNKDNIITSNFYTTIKSELEGAILTNISQYKNDRVIVFEFIINDFLDGKITKVLTLELMGRNNNLILTVNNIIIDAFNKNFNDKTRSIIPKLKYEYFPSNKLDLTTIDYKKVTTATYLSNTYTGVSAQLSRYLYNNNIDVFNVSLNPTKDLTNNQYYWFDIFDENNEKKHYNKLSELLNDLAIVPVMNYNKQIDFVNTELKKRIRLKNVLNRDLKKARINLEHKNVGDVIYSSGLNLSDKYATITDFSNNIIPIDNTKTLNENAQIHYKSYQKAKRAVAKLTELISDLEISLKLLEEITFFLTLNEPNIEDIESDLSAFGYNVKKAKKQKQVAQISEPIKLIYEDTLIYVGKNSTQNSNITHVIGSKTDYWLHVQGVPGSHVLIKSSNPSNKVLQFAAMLAANYSKLKNSNKIPISYTQIKNLRKIPGKHGSSVILTSYQTLLINIDSDLIRSVFIANKLI